MPAVGTKVIGLEQAQKKLNREIRKLKARAVGSLGAVAKIIKKKAVEKAPVKTGALRKSAYIQAGVVPGLGSIAEIGFGTPESGVNYSIIQHEGLSFEHPNGGEAQFLLKAVNETTPEVVATFGFGMRIRGS